ncbi:hypothetical protein EQ718_20525 (plasmid) [Paracoccus versutus]|uniref:hypothetical protein n=1 Tax=Paracoccus versutus TaxID=34007 RepID=UPI000ACC39C7|nr:hypothetical protein [Paracoccus versutus]WEJ81264.1 hypothetical protein EQ718_20525 [Paracoccus versutus]
MKLGDIDAYERRLRDAIVAFNKKQVSGVTLIEAVDEANLWPDGFEQAQPFLSELHLSALFDRSPLLLCAIAAEIGFRFEGVGTEFWNKLATALGVPITMSDRTRFGDVFKATAQKFRLSKPSGSAFSAHFSIISWPIANALLPLDLIGPVTRLLARAPATALPGPGRNANFPSLRAWASAAEGARLVDWLRFEASSERVLTSLLTENRGGGISALSYSRLHDSISKSSEAFFAARAARRRARRIRGGSIAPESPGRLIVTRELAGLRLYATWPALPGELVDEAKNIARAAGWRPQLWGAGARLHSDTALGDGPFALTHSDVPRGDHASYGDAAAVFGEGSAIAAALASRSIDWNESLLFDVNDERTRGEQRFAPFDLSSGYAWIACRAGMTSLDQLHFIGSVAGYRLFEASLADETARTILGNHGLLAAGDRSFVARHPIDAIIAPQGVVRPDRPFTIYRLGPPIDVGEPQRLRNAEQVSGQPRVRCEGAQEPDDIPISLSLLERDGAFSALIERRLQLRLESAHALRAVPLTTELEINGKLIVRNVGELAELPVTVDQHSPLLTGLYADGIRTRLLESGVGTLRFSVGRLASIEVPLARPKGAVDWSTTPPTLIDADGSASMACAPATAPHRFVPAPAVVRPESGAVGYVFRFGDGRFADPMNLLASPSFNLGDFAAAFNDLGSRQLRDGERGSGDLARARIAWSRAQCGTLQALAAKSRIVQQFEEPLIYNLCGREWFDRERDDKSSRSDPHQALYLVALEQGLASLPEGVPERYAGDFAEAFAVRARDLDPDWPLRRPTPRDDAMDDALNLGFTDAVNTLQARGSLPGVDPDDCDFGSPEDAWASAAEEAIRRIRRSRLTRLIAPDEGGRQLRDRFYSNIGVAEMAEDLAAWSRTFALPRGQLSVEAAAAALQLWLSPAACEALDAAMRVLVNDPFVARASRYAAIRMDATLGSAVS